MSIKDNSDLSFIAGKMPPRQATALTEVIGGDERSEVLDAARREVARWVDRIAGRQRTTLRADARARVVATGLKVYDCLAAELAARSDR